MNNGNEPALKDRLIPMRLSLVTYDCGERFEIAKFEPVRNKPGIPCKPRGGLWASPVDALFGWRERCKASGYSERCKAERFEFYFEGDVYVIHSLADLIRMPRAYESDFILYPDFEGMATAGCDAIYLTEKGERETRWRGLFGWDCESVLIMNPRCVSNHAAVLDVHLGSG